MTVEVTFFPEDMIVCMDCRKQIAVTSYELGALIGDAIVCLDCMKEREKDE